MGIGTIACVAQHDNKILPQSLKALVENLAKMAICIEKWAVFNLDPAFDSKYNKVLIKKTGCMPNIKVNPRNSKTKEPVPSLKENYKDSYVYFR
jgi:hypothetical protein